jgi:hypothetical protein
VISQWLRAIGSEGEWIFTKHFKIMSLKKFSK